jgi:site-specific recombinase XerD
VRGLKAIKPIMVAGYIQKLQDSPAKPSIKQHIATIRMLFDWLVTGQAIPTNPAHAVRGTKHMVSKGKAPVLTVEEPRALRDSIPTTRLIGVDGDGNSVHAPTLISLGNRAIIAAWSSRSPASAR